MAATLKPYLTAVRHTLTAAMCLENFSSQVNRRKFIFTSRWLISLEIFVFVVNLPTDFYRRWLSDTTSRRSRWSHRRSWSWTRSSSRVMKRSAFWSRRRSTRSASAFPSSRPTRSRRSSAINSPASWWCARRTSSSYGESPSKATTFHSSSRTSTPSRCTSTSWWTSWSTSWRKSTRRSASWSCRSTVALASALRSS